MSDAPASPAKKPRVRPDSPAPFPPADALVKPSIQIELADEDDDDESDDPDAHPARISLKKDAVRDDEEHVVSNRELVLRLRYRACGYAEDGSDRRSDTDYESASDSDYASDGVVGSNGRLRI